MTWIIPLYQGQVVKKLKEEFEIANDFAVPKIEKVVVNASIVDALGSKDVIEKVSNQLIDITGQKPKVTRARLAISNFKLRKGDPIGLMVTLRGKRAWYFLEKLIAIVAPRIRDFRGISLTKFDNVGNYSLGITEQILFSEIDYSKIDKIRGLVVTVVVKNSDKEKSKRLFELLGLPFKEGNA